MFDHNTIAFALAVAWSVFVILRCRAYARAAKHEAQLAATAEGLARGYSNIAMRAEANAIAHAGRAEQSAIRAKEAAQQQPAWGFGVAGGGGGVGAAPRFSTGPGTGATGRRGAAPAGEPGQGGATSPVYPRDPFFAKASEAARANTVMTEGRKFIDRLFSGEGHDAVGTADEQAESDR